jgi:hypothetical protein
MTPDNYIKARLATFAHDEAQHHGGIDCMLAVAFVVRNRVRAGWRGGNWMEVIESHDEVAATIYQHSAPDLRNINFRLLLAQVDDIYSGLAPDRYTEGALYYCELNHVERQWFKDNVLKDLQTHERCATVGNISFFK